MQQRMMAFSLGVVDKASLSPSSSASSMIGSFEEAQARPRRIGRSHPRQTADAGLGRQAYIRHMERGLTRGDTEILGGIQSWQKAQPGMAAS
jgi:hypothetical protein